MSDFADDFSQRPSAPRQSQRRVSQRDEEPTGQIPVEEEFAAEEEQEELSENFFKLTRKAAKLETAIEQASSGLILKVDKPETEVAAALRLLFPDDPTHADGSQLTFEHYKQALDKVTAENDFRDADLLNAASENRSNLRVLEDRKLAKAGAEEEEIDLLSSAFFAVQMASSAMMLFHAPIMHEIGLASTTAPNPAGIAAAQGHMLEAAQTLALIGAGSQFLQEFLNRVGGLIDINITDRFSTEGVDGVSNIRQTSFEAFRRRQEPTATQRILKYAHKKIPEALRNNERYLGWANYIGVRNSKTEADMFGETVKARLARSGSVRASGPNASLNRPLGAFARGVTTDTTEYLGNLTETVEAGIAMGRDLYNVLAGKSTDLNTLLDSVAAFMNTYYGPDAICCLVRLTGVSLNTDFIAAFGSMVSLLNVTSSFKMTTDMNSILENYNKTLDRFIARKLISRIEAMFNTIIKEINRFVDRITGADDTLNIILTCPPVADLIALLKQVILRLEELLENLILELAELFRLNNSKIAAVGEVGFDSALAGKLGRLLTRLADILEDCSGSPGSRTQAQQLIDRIRAVSRAPVPIETVPDGDVFEDFVKLPAFQTSSGLQFDPGAQTRVDNISETTADEILEACIGGVEEEEILKLATQTRHIRRRLEELNNG